MTTATNIKDLQLINESRKLEMASYKSVIFVAFFVFLATVLILNSVFLPAIAGRKGTQEGAAAGVGGGTGGTMSIEDVRLIYLGAALVQGFGGGVLIGVIEGGRIVLGMRNSFILVLLAWLILSFL
jgi:flagellar protein FlaJ